MIIFLIKAKTVDKKSTVFIMENEGILIVKAEIVRS